MRRHGLSAFIVALFALLVAACSPQPNGAATSVSPTVTPVSMSATASLPAAAAVPMAAPALAGGDYRVGPLDILDVSVFQVPDLSRTVQVAANGQISLPLIGAVVAAGKTTAELQDDIAKKYAATYLQSPQVSVFVRDAQSQRVTINGEVAKPGVYPTTGPTTLVQMIAIAGGLTDLADASGVVILRQQDGKRAAAKFDVKAIQAGTAEDPLVRGGDTVVVDRSGIKATFKGLRDTLPALGVFSAF
jgi:polysaccharide export outer membrane protein